MVMNKRGWMRILEATIAVMIVSGVLVVVYSRQVDRGVEPADYFFNLQRQILMDISSRSDLRLNVLKAVETPSNDDYVNVSEFVAGRIPGAFGHSIRICEFGGDDYCKMNRTHYIATRDKDVFVEEVVISSDFSDGSKSWRVPKKLRLFVWELR